MMITAIAILVGFVVGFLTSRIMRARSLRTWEEHFAISPRCQYRNEEDHRQCLLARGHEGEHYP